MEYEMNFTAKYNKKITATAKMYKSFQIEKIEKWEISLSEPDEGRIDGAFIDIVFKECNEGFTVSFDIVNSNAGNVGYGTVLLKAMIELVAKYEKDHNCKPLYVVGNLAYIDKHYGNWRTSLPFYNNFPNTYNNENENQPYNIIVEFRLKPQKSESLKDGKLVSLDELLSSNEVESANVLFRLS